MNIQELLKNGVTIAEAPANSSNIVKTDLIYISLRSALKAFFDLSFAYKKPQNEIIDIPQGSNIEITPSYIDRYYRIIIHFQHFFELSIKSILRSIDPSLPAIIDTAKGAITIFKLKNNQPITPDEDEKIKTVEFSEALQRLKLIIPHLNEPNYNSLSQYLEALSSLNTLRNKIWHRGVFILYYKELIEFVGKQILPAIEPMLKAIDRENKYTYWKYKPLHCGKDPISEIISFVNTGDLSGSNLWQLICLLELGRAAYQNPFPVQSVGTMFYKHFKIKYEAPAYSAAQGTPYIDIEICPVCGLQALVVNVQYSGTQDGYEIEEYDIECKCCNYTIRESNLEPGNFGYYKELYKIE